MTRIGPGDVVDEDAELADLFAGRGASSGRLVVVRDGRTVGIVEGEDLAEFFGDPGA
jgi:hypothetical protein